MQIKLKQVLDFHLVYNKIKSVSLPIITLYKFSKLVDAIETECKFYNNSLQSLINEYSEKDENGKPKFSENGENIQIQREYLTLFQTKFEELLNLSIDLPDISFTLKELEPLNLSISLEEFNLLLPFINGE